MELTPINGRAMAETPASVAFCYFPFEDGPTLDLRESLCQDIEDLIAKARQGAVSHADIEGIAQRYMSNPGRRAHLVRDIEELLRQAAQ